MKAPEPTAQFPDKPKALSGWRIIPVLCLLSLAFLASGCSPASLIFGGGFAAGKAAEDGRDFSEQWSDGVIRGRIMRDLATEAEINPLPLTIAVYQGHVTMAGVVSSRAVVNKIKAQVTRVEGVKTLTLNLRISKTK